MTSKTYDYIVVGAGSAGSVLANRLTASGQHKVLLLEAGRPDHFWTKIPIGFSRMIDLPAANWCYESEPEENTTQRRIPVPRGKLLGGSSAINGMVFVRGQAQDFDTWAQLGNRGWSFNDVLPFFRNMETYTGGEDENRGREGLLQVTDTLERGPLYDTILDAAEQAGIERTSDYNSGVQDGIGMTQMTISKGRRMSTARCYLDPAKNRTNLDILTDALTEGLILDGKKCVGVRYSARGQKLEARAVREVIVSAGAINSPQILELSGIGQQDRLHELGIKVAHELPGVGENLRDHYAPRMKWYMKSSGLTYNETARGLGLLGQIARFAIKRDGLLGMPASPVRAYVRTREGLASPDVGISWQPFLADGTRRLADKPGMTVIAHALRSESTGSIHLASSDPTVPPAIRFNFLSAEIDRTVTVAGMRIVRDIMAAPALENVVGDEFAPGTDAQTDDELLDYVMKTAETTYHPVGTCKMGSDPQAVVDDRLRVHGVEGLRVADASIMPTLTSGNTNAPSIMIGEKAASMVLEDAA
ncbi:MAG: choline dehydrogenase [Rhodospirillaceae bacterium]|nr:choline dehydrogenase [Rhodospirillaceae bacterium]